MDRLSIEDRAKIAPRATLMFALFLTTTMKISAFIFLAALCFGSAGAQNLPTTLAGHEIGETIKDLASRVSVSYTNQMLNCEHPKMRSFAESGGYDNSGVKEVQQDANSIWCTQYQRVKKTGDGLIECDHSPLCSFNGVLSFYKYAVVAIGNVIATPYNEAVKNAAQLYGEADKTSDSSKQITIWTRNGMKLTIASVTNPDDMSKFTSIALDGSGAN